MKASYRSLLPMRADGLLWGLAFCGSPLLSLPGRLSARVQTFARLISGGNRLDFAKDCPLDFERWLRV